MRYLSLLVIAIFSFSCSQKGNNTEEKEFQFAYTVDTVMVDSGEDFIFLKYGLNVAAISSDKKLLYNLNPTNFQLEVIDLESLKLSNRIQLEKEGPTGIGNPRSLHISQDGKFHFLTFSDVRVFDSSLETMKAIKFRKENFENLAVDESLGFNLTLSDDGKKGYVEYGPDDEELAKKGLAVLNLQNLQLKTIPLEIYSRIQPYVRSFYQDGQLQTRTIESTYIDQAGDRVLISSPNFNEVYILDQITDSVSRKIFHSSLTSDFKKVPEITSFESVEEMRAAFQKENEKVTFSRFYYDDFNEKFWRFSRELDRKIGDSSVFKAVVTIYDKDLNQQHEAIFPDNIFGFKFFKDGKLWSYVNVDDELGFAVFTFDF
ncbi:MAG TPA: hypothetical protein DEV63_13070 [Algoriphagus sp.]|nr:hypothetical protein [Algoriphagus sp.]